MPKACRGLCRCPDVGVSREGQRIDLSTRVELRRLALLMLAASRFLRLRASAFQRRPLVRSRAARLSKLYDRPLIVGSSLTVSCSS